jgi:hypothetical protein
MAVNREPNRRGKVCDAKKNNPYDRGCDGFDMPDINGVEQIRGPTRFSR